MVDSTSVRFETLVHVFMSSLLLARMQSYQRYNYRFVVSVCAILTSSIPLQRNVSCEFGIAASKGIVAIFLVQRSLKMSSRIHLHEESFGVRAPQLSDSACVASFH